MLQLGLHQFPGFAVFFQAHLFGFAVGIEAEHGRGHAGLDGENVPDVERDDVGDEEINVARGIDGASFADSVGGAGFVSLGAETVGGLDLDAEKAMAVVEDEVVAFGVSPGLGNAEAERAGFVEEGGFRALRRVWCFLGRGRIFWMIESSLLGPQQL
jgi:hypothetical protein